MQLVCAMDLSGGQVVHGCSGNRSSYTPLTWGLSPTAEPVGYLKAIRPRYLYVADLDRIAGTGSHDEMVLGFAGLVDRCYLDRGCLGPGDILRAPFIENVIGTETAGPDLSGFCGGYLSVDVKEGRVVPTGEDPVALLSRADAMNIDGCIYLHITAVGSSSGIDPGEAGRIRSATDLPLLYGGGVRGEEDLGILHDAGFDGAIIATALHTGAIPLDLIRRGVFC
ncbi:nickel transporter [Methanocalculus chunghsingensis]|uniref:Nickel transporter n=2 Tax=Methanocalculus chunghsingensis TaxID=156457 RepID=A0A8J7W5T3_9EURY|nr:HisA/HisF-related TIM barrel protein [Methanocalculus chunghsingensis]MBR1368884.1 nickel transporter [Methanocalculus chunghsingensis]